MPIQKQPIPSPLAPMPRAIMLLGALNAGKSFTAVSASKTFPPLPWQPFTPLNPKPKDWVPVPLSDVFVHAWEPDCFAGFVDAGLCVPPHWDLAGVTSNELTKAIDDVCAETTARVKAGTTNVVVADTISALNTHIYAHAFFLLSRVEKEDDSDKIKGDNMQKVWGKILDLHKRYVTGLLATGAPLIVFNCHPKVTDSEARSKEQKAKDLHAANLKVKGLGQGGPVLTPEITGQAQGEYTRDCSIIAFLEAQSETVGIPGKPGQFTKKTTRWLNPHKKDDVMARSKYACLSEREPADLRAIFAKIRGE